MIHRFPSYQPGITAHEGAEPPESYLRMSEDAEENEDDASEFDLVVNLARGVTIAKAARRVGLSARTVKRRLAEPAFAARVQEYRRHLLEAAASRLAGSMSKAIRTMIQLLDADEDSVRLRAAQGVLDFSIRTNQLYDLQQRVALIESSLAQNQQGK